MAWVADVDVDGQEHGVAVVERDRERFVQDGGQPAHADLGHLVRPHALRGHPVESFRLGPVAPKSDLEKTVASRGTGLDESPHGLAVAVERAEVDVAGVGVRIEVHNCDATESVVAGNAGDVG